MSNRPRLWMWLVAIGCLVSSGCVTKSVSDAGTSVHYDWWLPIGILVAGILFVPMGWVAKEHSARFGWGLIIAGPILALVFGPSMLLERVLVRDNGFDVHSGIWGMTAKQTVDFDSVKSCRIVEEDTGGRRSRRIEVLLFDRDSGPAARLPLNNDVKIEARKEILLRASQLGIPVMQ